MQRFSKKVAIVTGAGSGIGRATAILLASEGASVVVSDVDDAAGDETVALIEAAGHAAVYQHADVAHERDHIELVAAAEQTYGSLDIAVNNAGILGSFVPAADIPVEEYDRIMAVNLRGVFLGMKHQVPSMLTTDGGSIVNVASVAGLQVQPLAAAYTASKHALVGLTKAFAYDYAATGIRVNAVCPGGVETNIAAHLDLSAMADAPNPHPLGRSGQSMEIATAIAWLASDEAAFAVGTVMALDGGLTLRLG